MKTITKTTILLTSLVFFGCATKGDLKNLENSVDQKWENVKNELTAELKKEIYKNGKEQVVAEIKNEVYQEISETLKKDREEIQKVVDSLNKELSDYKVAIREILVESLVQMKKDLNVSLSSVVTDPEFVKNIENSLNDKLKSLNNAVFLSEKDGIIKQCVNDALDEIVVQKIGVKSSDVKVVEPK